MFVAIRSIPLVLFVASLLKMTQAAYSQPIESPPADAIKFVQAHCYDCHQGQDSEAAFDLTQLVEPSANTKNKTDRDSVATWVHIYDRVSLGEMPPHDVAQPSRAEIAGFLASTKRWLVDLQSKEAKEVGRVRGRRLNNLQLERSLQDILGVDIPLAKDFSDEARVGGFTTVADGQAMSHFQLEQHLHAVDTALEEASRRASSLPDEWTKTFKPQDIVRAKPKARTREPELRKGLAIIWSSRLIFYGRLPVTTAADDGWYRFRLTASALKPPKAGGVWCTVRSGRCVSSAPLLNTIDTFEATSEPKEWTFEAWLSKGEMLEIRPGDTTLPMAKFDGGQVGAGEGESQDVPGVAFHELTMERFHRGPSNETIRNLLFGELKIRESPDSKQLTGVKPTKRREQKAAPETIELISDDPRRDAAVRMTAFARRAFRRLIQEADIADYIEAVESQLLEGKSLADALQNGYRALLCSPRFLYLQENPGNLDDYAIASRLSYFLWQSAPDNRLLNLAHQGKLRDRTQILEETKRMLNASRGTDFIEQFAEQWLDLRDIDFTEPDPKLYRDFDPIVQQAMLAETRTFLHKMLVENRSVKELIDSDYTFLNSRLARFYGIGGVEGDDVRLVKVSESDRRGGLLTHGSILKITANGTTTSPVLRGVWIGERLLGEHIPPPPQNVPAIEPDIRGATSIRQMLEKHRSNESCASCHVKIDPPGFALENYDPAGRWRDRYGKSKSKIDASYALADGRKFADIDEFRELVLSNPERMARCVVEKLITYGTGAPVCFADRDEINRMVVAAKKDDYGLRSLLEAVVTSEIFLRK